MPQGEETDCFLCMNMPSCSRAVISFTDRRCQEQCVMSERSSRAMVTKPAALSLCRYTLRLTPI